MATHKINKSAFVRDLPVSMSAQDVVKAAAAKDIKITENYVSTIRYNAKKTAAKKSGGAAPVKRGPGRPGKDKTPVLAGGGSVGSGLVAEIERIVERKVSAMLKAKLGTLFGA
jgi:hypothetical protein